MADKNRGESDAERTARADRATRLRKACNYDTQVAFADFLGVSTQRWNNVEVGFPIRTDMAILLVRKVPGLTLDWLYLGKPDGLPLELARRLGEVPEARRRITRA